MPRRLLDPMSAKPWRVTARGPDGEELLKSNCDTVRAAAALAVVLTAFWPVAVTCCRPGSDNALTSWKVA